VFRTCNLVGGWFQRLDKLRKYGFGSVLIFEGAAAKNFEIFGCWLFKGQDIPPEMRESDDCDLYEWIKADLESEQDKKKIEEAWTWIGEFHGRKFTEEGKVFK